MESPIHITWDLSEESEYGTVIWWKRLPDGTAVILYEDNIKNFKLIPIEN